VATPIGNLEDISNRAARTLRAATWIAAEDTRSSRPLLQSLGIGHARTLALHAHNEASQTGRLLDLIRTSCKGRDAPMASVCERFNRAGHDLTALLSSRPAGPQEVY